MHEIERAGERFHQIPGEGGSARAFTRAGANKRKTTRREGRRERPRAHAGDARRT
jgi:hypothetical protein